MAYNIVLYMLGEAETKLAVAKRGTKQEARAVMKSLAGRGWEMERRPDIHTFGNLVMTFEQEVK